MEIEKPSRYKPLKTDEAWERLVQASENIKVLGRLSDAEAQRSSEAVDTLKTVQPSGKLKRYKQFLCDVLCNSGPEFVLLCAVALGQVRGVDMKHGDRVGLISKIKANKDNTDINDSTVRSLAIKYHIPKSVTDLPPLVHVVVERPRKRKRKSIESATGIPGNGYDLTPDTAPAVLPESATGLTGDFYELAPEDAPAIIAEIRGQIWLIDPYNANTHQPFVTIPISWKLRDQIILQRPRMM